MTITDLKGYEIEITNLKEAVRIAKRNTGYSHKDKSFSEFDKRQKAFWTDMFEKLEAIYQCGTGAEGLFLIVEYVPLWNDRKQGIFP